MFSDVRYAFVVSKNVLCYTVSKNVNRVVGFMFNQLTESDIKKMEEEIEYRKVVVRKEKLEAVKEARAQGDLSENFEYYAAKKDKNANEKRIRYLDRMVRTAEIIKDESADDEVGLNNTVRVYFEEDDEVMYVAFRKGNELKKIVTPDIHNMPAEVDLSDTEYDSIDVYVWNEKMQPYAEVNKIEK